MDEFKIQVDWDGKLIEFNVRDYVHHDDRCKYEVFQESTLVATFEPDNRGLLHICKNSDGLSEQVIHLIADKIESQPWH